MSSWRDKTSDVIERGKTDIYMEAFDYPNALPVNDPETFYPLQEEDFLSSLNNTFRMVQDTQESSEDPQTTDKESTRFSTSTLKGEEAMSSQSEHLDRLASKIEQNFPSYGLTEKQAYDLCYRLDYLADQIDKQASRQKEGLVIERNGDMRPDDKDKDFIGEFDKMRKQRDSDEDYMGAFTNIDDAEGGAQFYEPISGESSEELMGTTPDTKWTEPGADEAWDEENQGPRMPEASRSEPARGRRRDASSNWYEERKPNKRTSSISNWYEEKKASNNSNWYEQSKKNSKLTRIGQSPYGIGQDDQWLLLSEKGSFVGPEAIVKASDATTAIDKAKEEDDDFASLPRKKIEIRGPFKSKKEAIESGSGWSVVISSRRRLAEATPRSKAVSELRDFLSTRPNAPSDAESRRRLLMEEKGGILQSMRDAGVSQDVVRYLESNFGQAAKAAA